MTHHDVKRGLDIPIAGAATGAPVDVATPATVAWSPTEFRGIIPRPIAREGTRVKRGEPLFHHKSDKDLVFVSPVSGVVKEIRRGRRRVITDYIVEVDGDEAVQYATHTEAQLSDLSRADAVALVKQSGLWPALRTRPLDQVPMSSDVPQHILVSGTDSGPLMPSADALLGADDKAFVQAGVNVLKALTDGSVLLATGKTAPAALTGLSGVEHHTFSGPHPSGDPTVQVNLACPTQGNNGQVWYIRAWDLAALGRFALTGQFHAERVYAAVGTGVKAPRLVRTVLGAPILDIVGELKDGDNRIIRGSVLTGEAVDVERWAPFYSRAIHVLPEKVDRTFMGWIGPSLDRFSIHRAFLSGVTGAGSKTWDLQPGVWGGHRALVPIGAYEKVVATPDILPSFLIRSILAQDLEESISLGLLDLSEEEAALCTFVCPSKIEFRSILQQGLQQFVKES